MINPKKKKRPYLDYDLEGYIKGQQTARTDATSNQQATTQRQVAENNTSEKVQQRKVANENKYATPVEHVDNQALGRMGFATKVNFDEIMKKLSNSNFMLDKYKNKKNGGKLLPPWY